MMVLAILATAAVALWVAIVLISDSLWPQQRRAGFETVVYPWLLPAVLWLAWWLR